MAAAPQRHPGPRRPAPPRRVEALAAVGLRPDAARGHEPGTEDDGGEGATTGGHGGDGPGAQAQGVGETWRGLASCGLRFDKKLYIQRKWKDMFFSCYGRCWEKISAVGSFELGTSELI